MTKKKPPSIEELREGLGKRAPPKPPKARKPDSLTRQRPPRTPRVSRAYLSHVEFCALSSDLENQRRLVQDLGAGIGALTEQVQLTQTSVGLLHDLLGKPRDAKAMSPNPYVRGETGKLAPGPTLQVGSVVRLKSGGPKMTVTKRYETGNVACLWFAVDATQQQQSFAGSFELNALDVLA